MFFHCTTSSSFAGNDVLVAVEDSIDQSGPKLFNQKSGGKIFPPLKFLCHSWPRRGSLTFVAIDRITGYQFWLICIRRMWFHFRIGQNGIGKNTLLLYRSSNYFILDCICGQCPLHPIWLALALISWIWILTLDVTIKSSWLNILLSEYYPWNYFCCKCHLCHFPWQKDTHPTIDKYIIAYKTIAFLQGNWQHWQMS